MEDVKERLRVSLRESNSEEYKGGYAAGERWAKKHATAAELQRLETLRDSLENQPLYDWDVFFEEDDQAVNTVGQRLYFAIQPEFDGFADNAAAFWIEVTVPFSSTGNGQEHVLPEFARGFAEGAYDIWYEVQKDL